MSGKLMFVYNPHAGKGLIKSRLAEIIDIFVKNGYEVSIHPTQKYNDAYEVVKKIGSEYDLVVCSGGDGTLDEAVSGMMEREKRIPIGYIPAGTTNDFANSLHISRNLLEAAEIAVSGGRFSCDVGRFNDDIFVYIAAFGIFTDVAYETKQEVKNILGHMAYILEGIKRLYAIKSYPMKVTHNEEVIEEDFIFGMVTNSRSVGGFRGMIGKNVTFDDGLFEVTLIKKPKNAIELQEVITALLMRESNSKHMYTFKAGKLLIESEEEVAWTLDGEFGGNHHEVVIQNEKQALDIMVNAKKMKELREIPKLEE